MLQNGGATKHDPVELLNRGGRSLGCSDFAGSAESDVSPFQFGKPVEQ